MPVNCQTATWSPSTLEGLENFAPILDVSLTDAPTDGGQSINPHPVISQEPMMSPLTITTVNEEEQYAPRLDVSLTDAPNDGGQSVHLSYIDPSGMNKYFDNAASFSNSTETCLPETMVIEINFGFLYINLLI